VSLTEIAAGNASAPTSSLARQSRSVIVPCVPAGPEEEKQ
jgi:hypothetical protein